MLSNRLRWGVSTAVALVFMTCAGAALAACVCVAPEDVLKCYSEAYTSRDADLLESVIADDYVWVAVVFPRAEIFDRETTVKASTALLTNELVEDCSLNFGDNYILVAGDDDDTWRIEKLLVTLTVKLVSEEEPHSTTVCATLYVRRTDGVPGFEIYREVTFEGMGCD